MSYYRGFKPYVPVAKRREKAAREMAKLAKKGRMISPIAIEGRLIASTFWGKAWCENLESYSDYESRLPRGRTYVRNGSVVDLQIERGQVRATVSGSELYTIEIEIGVLPKKRWDAICRDCTGSIGSLVELLQGKLSKNVMERVCRAEDGLFPSPDEIELRCSCPDWADMCKHVAAALYGVGARLDAKPDLLFELRGVDRSQLISGAGKDLPLTQRPVAEERLLAEDDVAALFGIEMEAAGWAHRSQSDRAARATAEGTSVEGRADSQAGGEGECRSRVGSQARRGEGGDRERRRARDAAAQGSDEAGPFDPTGVESRRGRGATHHHAVASESRSPRSDPDREDAPIEEAESG